MQEEHPGWIPENEALKDAPPVTKEEMMDYASREAGKIAQEREAARRSREEGES